MGRNNLVVTNAVDKCDEHGRQGGGRRECNMYRDVTVKRREETISKAVSCAMASDEGE